MECEVCLTLLYITEGLELNLRPFDLESDTVSAQIFSTFTSVSHDQLSGLQTMLKTGELHSDAKYDSYHLMVWFGLCCLMTSGLSKDIRCHVWPYFFINKCRSDIRPHIKWAVSLVILHMVTSIFLQGLCGYIWVNILTLAPWRGPFNSKIVLIIANRMDWTGLQRLFHDLIGKSMDHSLGNRGYSMTNQ